MRSWFPVVSNYRGRPVGTWLGPAFTVVVASGLVSTALVLAAAGLRPVTGPRLLWVALGLVGVSLAGLYDDLQPNRTRGLVRQLRLLARGRVTSGVVKLGAIALISFGIGWALRLRGGHAVLGAAVMAGCANLWNLLDVAHGRSLKLFLPVTIGLAVAADGLVYHVLGVAAPVAAVAALPFDLGERAMLGDAGANVLGLVVGIEAVGALSMSGLWIALGAILALHALSETVTLTRAIRAVRPLRWIDDLGRSGPALQEAGGEDSTST